jgi:hypothetical protein
MSGSTAYGLIDKEPIGVASKRKSTDPGTRE